MTDHIPAGGPVEDPPPPERFDPAAILRALNEHGVCYVVIGGVAATLHGAPVVTYDLDLTPQQTRDNITRLAAALTSIGALRYTDPDLPFTTPGPEDFEYLVESFASPIGYIDVFREVQAIGGYDQLRPRAHDADVDGIRIAIASLGGWCEVGGGGGRRKRRLRHAGLRGSMRSTVASTAGGGCGARRAAEGP
jgi:hypothetical protein